MAPTRPVNLYSALAGFSETYSPRIVGRMNDYDVKIAHALGEHVRHTHDDTDEFFLVLEGEFDITLYQGDGSNETVALRAGDVFVVPRGLAHKPSSNGGSVLMFERAGTSSTGDHHDGPVPGHVDSTTGHGLA